MTSPYKAIFYKMTSAKYLGSPKNQTSNGMSKQGIACLRRNLKIKPIKLEEKTYNVLSKTYIKNVE